MVTCLGRMVRCAAIVFSTVPPEGYVIAGPVGIANEDVGDVIINKAIQVYQLFD